MDPYEDSDLATAARRWHPWLRIQRVIRVILETRWGADEWPIVKAELRHALKERRRASRLSLARSDPRIPESWSRTEKTV